MPVYHHNRVPALSSPPSASIESGISGDVYKRQAMTSATPGKTMLINHFLINKSWYIVDPVSYTHLVYGERARRLKEIFLRHGFHLVYDNDLGDPVADGFYFTIGYRCV